VNGNGQLDAGEGGVMGATLFLRNASGIVGLYNTGNGQFSFPGLMVGEYNLSETTPPDYHAEGSATFDLNIECGATVTQNFFNINANQTPALTFTPTRALQSTPAPRVTAAPPPTRAPTTASASAPPKNPASPATGFTAFAAGPTYYIAGCGTINASGLYRLTTSLVSQWDCIQINNENVIFDCQGNSLDGADFNGYGIVVHHVGFFGARPRNIEIRNCHMTRHKYGIFIDAAENLFIHDNVTSGNFNDVDGRHYGVFLGLVEGGGIRVNDTRGALLTNNRADNEAIALDIRNSNGVVVRGNSANGNSAWGVHFYNVKYSEISSNVSSNNLRYCTWGSGVVGPGCDAGGIMLQSGSSFNLVSGNTISGSNGNGIFIKAHGTACGDSNTIVNNRIVGTLYNGIELSFCQNNRLQGNEISNSLDGIWMGFATNNEVDAGNLLHDMSNHGIISWNSQGNNVSNNRITNSREALYFYSSAYDRQQFYFVPGEPADHVSRGNCLCANALMNNTAAAFHLANSIKNQMVNNTLTNNGTNFLLEGNTSGNVIRDNVIQGGSYDFGTGRAEPAAFRAPAAFGLMNPVLTIYDVNGTPLSRDALRRVLWTSSPGDPFDLRWFKYKLATSLGNPVPPFEAIFNRSSLRALLALAAN
jgi:parallel beta-helix repeat protein